MVVLLGPGKVKNIIIVLHQEHFFVLFIMGIILMVASLVIVDFVIKKNEYHKNVCLFLFTFAIIFENYKFVFNIQKYCANLCSHTKLFLK